MKKLFFCLSCFFCTLRADPVSVKINSFANDFYEKSLDEENLCFSPYSLFQCLSSAYLGAENTTLSEMQAVLHISEDKKEFSKILSSLAEDLETKEFQTADAVWLAPDSFLSPIYRTLVDNLDTRVRNLNFSDPKQAAETINAWVFDKTSGMIPKLISSSDCKPNTKAILTNAVRFQSSWFFPFSKRMTTVGDFHVNDKETVSVPMMHQAKNLPYYEDEECSLLLLPIKSSNCRFSCFFLLPKTSETEVSLRNLTSKIKHTEETFVSVTIPKFKIRHQSEAKALLQDLGMHSAFSPKADFSSLCENKRLYFDKVIHETYFSIDEQGIEAAAATAITMLTHCAARALPKPVSFIADKPFIFGILDLNSDLVLFLGKLTRP